MKLFELEESIGEIVQDSSFDGTQTRRLINRAIQSIAGAVDLPELVKTDTVLTTGSSSSASLPAAYMKGLFFVGSANQNRRIGDRIGYRSYNRFLRRWPDPALDKAGPIVDVAVKGTSLVYQPCVADTLTLQFYRKPAALTGASDSVEAIPAHLQEGLIVNFVCREIYSRIEDGVEGKKVNTAYHAALYNQALSDLRDFIGQDDEPEYVQNETEADPWPR